MISASQVMSRHKLLKATIGVQEAEMVSYSTAYYLPIIATTAVLVNSLLAVASFLLYNYKADLSMSQYIIWT